MHWPRSQRKGLSGVPTTPHLSRKRHVACRPQSKPASDSDLAGAPCLIRSRCVPLRRGEFCRDQRTDPLICLVRWRSWFFQDCAAWATSPEPHQASSSRTASTCPRLTPPLAASHNGASAAQRAVSSAVEHTLHTRGVAGSNPALPTILQLRFGLLPYASGCARCHGR